MSEFTDGLRSLADWYDEHPDFPVPYEARRETPCFTVGCHNGKEEFAEMVSTLGGARDKFVDGSYMRVVRDFGGGVKFEVWANRDEVCEAVVVGTETVIEDEVITPAVTRRVEVERPVIRWECAPVLA